MLAAPSPLGRSGGHFNHGRNMIFPLGQERQARQVIYEPAGIDHIHRETITVSDLAMRIRAGAPDRRIGSAAAIPMSTDVCVGDVAVLPDEMLSWRCLASAPALRERRHRRLARRLVALLPSRGPVYVSPASPRIARSAARPLSVSAYAPLSRSWTMNPLMAMDCIACAVMPTAAWLTPVAVQNKITRSYAVSGGVVFMIRPSYPAPSIGST
jgi:hypothetical protein